MSIAHHTSLRGTKQSISQCNNQFPNKQWKTKNEKRTTKDEKRKTKNTFHFKPVQKPTLYSTQLYALLQQSIKYIGSKVEPLRNTQVENLSPTHP